MLLASVEVRHAPAVEPLAEQRFRLFIELARSPYVLRDNQTASWPQEAGRLGIERLLVDCVAEAFERPDNVKRTIRKQCPSVISLLETDKPIERASTGDLAGSDDLIGHRANSDDLGTTMASQPETAATQPTPCIKD